jgi:hypothetical protein
MQVAFQMYSGVLSCSYYSIQSQQSYLIIRSSSRRRYSGSRLSLQLANRTHPSLQTAANIRAFILLMILHPEVQRKGHEEITRVCDSNQLPSYDDADSLPYVTAIVLEVLRWTVAAPLGTISSWS